ncbi:hypothetical protein GCM10023195_13420 [Actinoallomurus liliacearum]|uniref:Uncharacterized protein n=1 Tax=Actinoallomurus liliacearum TaxID=1080073 RepID=A0ABP8TH47_9ACTN
MHDPGIDGMTAWRWLAVFCPPELAAWMGRYSTALATHSMPSRIDHQDDPRADVTPAATPPETPRTGHRSVADAPGRSAWRRAAGWAAWRSRRRETPGHPRDDQRSLEPQPPHTHRERTPS